MSDLHRYKEFLLELQGDCCDFPHTVTMKRTRSAKGESMPDDLIEKIIADLSDIPSFHKFQINLSRVNEPFLDHRIFDIARMINARLSHASLVFFNGTPLNDVNIEKLVSLNRVSRLNISLNEYEAQEYTRAMGLPFDRTLSVLQALHWAKLNGRIYFPVVLSRVGDGSERDDGFEAFVKSNFSVFDAEVSSRSGWLGLVDEQRGEIPDAGCSQWFKLHFSSDGREAFCCIDAEGKYGNSNARERHVLEVYNRAERRVMRATIRSRLGYDICGKCPLLS